MIPTTKQGFVEKIVQLYSVSRELASRKQTL